MRGFKKKMNRATPVEIRKSLEMFEAMKNAGLRFVPMPCLSETDYAALIVQVQTRLDMVVRQAEVGEIEHVCVEDEVGFCRFCGKIA